MSRLKGLGLAFILLFVVVSAVASASDSWPGWFKRSPRTGGGTTTYAVAEPAAITLLGAGLIALGLYARKKRGKKQ